MKKSVMKHPLSNREGIGIIEIVIVLAVVAIIAAFAVPALRQKKEAGNPSNASGALRAATTAQSDIEPGNDLPIPDFNANVNDVPSTSTNQKADVSKPKITDNKSTAPTDRLYFEFDFFDRVSAGRCTGPVTVGRLDGSGNGIVNESTNLQLSGTDGVTFFGDDGCLTSFQSVSIADGAGTTEFFFRPFGVEQGQMTATADGFANAEADFITNERAAQGIEAYFIRDVTGSITDLQVTVRLTDESFAGEEINGFRIDAQNQLSPLPTPNDASVNINIAGYDQSDWTCSASGTALGCSGTETMQTATKSLFDIFFNTTDFTPPSSLSVELLHDGSLVTWVDAPLTTQTR